MGCDIHMYVEYKQQDAADDQREEYWYAYGSRINPGRDYEMFGALAGVRTEHVPHIEPRGLPPVLGYYSKSDYWIAVVNDPKDMEGYTDPITAQRYKDHGSIEKTVEIRGLTHSFISNPDWHTPSWLTPQEFEDAINVATEDQLEWAKARLAEPEIDLSDLGPELRERGQAFEQLQRKLIQKMIDRPALMHLEYRALLAAMRTLEAGGNEVRVVFWFDN